MEKFDVFIAGGGLSGVAAAVGAARCGASVALAERNFMLGGTATAALVNPLQTFHSPSGRVIGGAAQEMVGAMVERGASPGHLPDPIGFATSVTPVDPDTLKVFLAEWLAAEGVRVLPGHRFRGMETSGGGGAVRAVSLEDTKDGIREIEAKCFVDASGDGDMTLAAGCEMEIDPDCQPMSLIFVLDRVDTAAVTDYQKKHPDEFYMPGDLSVLDRGYPGVAGFFKHVEKARASGRLTVPRDRLLFFGAARRGEIVVNTSRIAGYRGLDGGELAAAMIEGLRQVREIFNFMKDEIPGFGDARVVRVADHVGVRETRRLAGRYIMNEKDVAGNAHFDDAIAKGAYPIDIHSSSDPGLRSIVLSGRGYYDIPLRSLLNKTVENLVTVGKCISVTHEGFSSTRVMPTCMATGQAGGVAAALHALTGRDFEDLAEKIQTELRRQEAIIFDEDIVPEEI